MIRSLVLILLSAVCMAGTITAQPDQTKALEKAKKKFEDDIKKCEGTLLEGIDKTLLQKKGDKTLQQKLNYERPLFITHQLVPTAYPSEVYLRDRSKATKALLDVYQPAITALTKTKKFLEVEAIEDSLDEILKASRGYGLAFPKDLEKNPEVQYQFVNKGSGLVIDTENKDGVGSFVLTPKVGKSKPTQCWKIEREEKGFMIRNVKSGHLFDVPGSDPRVGVILGTSGWQPNGAKETPSSLLFRLNSIRREIAIETILSDLMLTSTKRAIKGVPILYVTQEKKETPASADQLWTIVTAE